MSGILGVGGSPNYIIRITFSRSMPIPKEIITRIMRQSIKLVTKSLYIISLFVGRIKELYILITLRPNSLLKP